MVRPARRNARIVGARVAPYQLGLPQPPQPALPPPLAPAPVPALAPPPPPAPAPAARPNRRRRAPIDEDPLWAPPPARRPRRNEPLNNEEAPILVPRRSARLARRQQPANEQQAHLHLVQAEVHQAAEGGDEVEEQPQLPPPPPPPAPALPAIVLPAPPLYHPGSQVWGRLGKLPFWPAVVVADDAGQHYRQQTCANGVVRRWYHLQWEADGRTSWLGLTAIRPFLALWPILGPLHHLRAAIRQEPKNKINLAALKEPRGEQKVRWDLAIAAAERRGRD